MQSTIIPAKGSKFATNLPTYAGVSDRASMIIQRGHDEKTPFSNHLLPFGLDNLVCRCSGTVSILSCVKSLAAWGSDSYSTELLSRLH